METTTVERVQSAGRDPNMQGTGDAGCVVPGRYDADMDKICVQLAQERSRMEVSLSGDFEAGGSAGKEYSAAVSGRTLSAGQKSPAAVPGVKALIVQKYRAAAFRDQVSRMRMDLNRNIREKLEEIDPLVFYGMVALVIKPDKCSKQD